MSVNYGNKRPEIKEYVVEWEKMLEVEEINNGKNVLNVENALNLSRVQDIVKNAVIEGASSIKIHVVRGASKITVKKFFWGVRFYDGNKWQWYRDSESREIIGRYTDSEVKPLDIERFNHRSFLGIDYEKILRLDKIEEVEVED